MKKLLATSALAAILAAGTATTTQANDRSLKATMIPASACTLAPGSSAQLLFGVWTASAGEVVIECPLPLNNIEMGTTGTDNDISKFRIHYQDSDAAASSVLMNVSLYKITAVPRSNSLVCQADLAPTTTSFTTTTVPCVHDVASGGAFYTFRISMLVSPNSGNSASFIGIDFP